MLWFLILMLVLPYMAASAIVRRVQARRAMHRLMVLAAGQTAAHSMALVTMERQTVHKDEYGSYVFDAFNREIDRFVASTVLRKAARGDYLKASRRFDVRDVLQDVAPPRSTR